MPNFDAPTVDRNTITKLVKSIIKPNMMALELGAFQGQTTAIIAELLKPYNGTMYVVDWWKAQSKGTAASYPGGKWENVCTPELISKRLNDFESNMQELGLEIFLLKMPTDAAAAILRDNLFDFIFVDAAHYYYQAKNDIFNFFPKLKIGGIMCGHDCETRLENLNMDLVNQYCMLDSAPDGMHYGVIKAVGECFAEYELENTIWSVLKTKAIELTRPMGVPQRFVI